MLAYSYGRMLFRNNHGTVSIACLPETGIGSRLLGLAREHTPTMLYFGAQPGLEPFYEKNGCEKSLQSYLIKAQGGKVICINTIIPFPKDGQLTLLYDGMPLNVSKSKAYLIEKMKAQGMTC